MELTKTNIILSHQLEAGAVIPQCLDNQFVTEEIFREMSTKTLDFEDREVQSERDKIIMTEWHRSLLYSPQCIINRAFLWNNRVVYSAFRDTKENQQNRNAFIKLLSNRKIVPYLFKEKKIDEEPSFDLDPDGIALFKRLLTNMDKVDCVKLSEDDEHNKLQTDKITNIYRKYFTSIHRTPESVLQNIAEGIVSESKFYDNPQKRQEYVNGFREELKKWGKLLDETIDEEYSLAEVGKREPKIQRNLFYKKFICHEGKNSVSKGHYISPTNDPFVFEKKKLLDLRYNTNLSDSLKRYAFTPSGFPTRSALSIEPEVQDQAGGEQLLSDLANNIRHTFMENTQEGFNLPLLSKLSIHDIYELRQLASYNEFVAAQNEILLHPLDCLNYIENFSNSVRDFNNEVSNWYYNQKRIPVIEKRYRTVIRVIVKAGGAIIAAKTGGVLAASLGVIADLPENIENYIVNLAVDYIPIGKKEVDRNLGYSLEIIDRSHNVAREALEELVNKAMEYSNGKEVSPIGKDIANISKG